MITINKYLDDIKNKYPNTKEVLEQIEELKDTLNIKVEEYQSEGLSYEDALESALSSQEGIEELFEGLTTETKVVYLGRIYLCSQVICGTFMLLIAFMLLILPKYSSSFTLFDTNTAFFGFTLIFNWVVTSIIVTIPLMLFTVIPKTFALKYSYTDYRRNLRFSLLGFFVISIIIFIVNIVIDKTFMWSIWFSLGILNVPLIVFTMYHLFKTKIFDVKNGSEKNE